ncbi:hypothetical protein UPYG_G00309140 [Umbra pygmaea]|uniref:Vestigial n=1 Tax=Umbra pygmaea TaxID=75934 RepID=A0ABD0W3J4_UMBPY
MSCLDVMFHQSYGAHYRPTSSAAAAAAYKAAYYHHQHHLQPHLPQVGVQDQRITLEELFHIPNRKLGVYSRMQQDGVEQQCPGGRQQQLRGGGGSLAGEQVSRRSLESSGLGSSGKDSQPAEAEYLSSRCVLFTYFHGDIGDVVDEHFSRALNQPSAFTGETKANRSISGSAGVWKDSLSPAEGQCGSLSSSLWGGGYPSQTSPCLPVHPDFHVPDGALWAGHALPQPSLPPPGSLSDPWAYSLSPQTSSGYTHVHDVYPHTHPHVHHRHPHTVLHPHQSHGPGLDSRFSPLLIPGVKSHSPVSTTHCSHSPGTHNQVKTEVEQASTSPPTLAPLAWPAAHHIPLDSYDPGLDQDKVKAVWF